MTDFMDNILASAETYATSRAQARQFKGSDLSIDATFLAYLSSVQENGRWRNVESIQVPKQTNKKTRDGKKEYPAALELRCRIKDLKLVPGQCERLESKGEAQRWRVLANVNYFEKAREYLMANADRAWAREDGQLVHYDYDMERVRTYVVEEDKQLIKQRWIEVNEGSEVKIKTRDNKESVFRKRNPRNERQPMVQQFAPVSFVGVTCDQWLSMGEREEQDGDNKITMPMLIVSTSYTCKGESRVDEDYDCSLPPSEQIHAGRNPDAHQLVPVEQLRTRRASPPSTCYFYVKDGYHTPWRADHFVPDAQGIMIRRQPQGPSDFLRENMENPDETTGRVTLMFFVTQWFGRVPNDVNANFDMYSVKVTHLKDQTHFWKEFGINDARAYAAIAQAHAGVLSITDKMSKEEQSLTRRQNSVLGIPLHVEANLWERATLDDANNAADRLNNREQLRYMRGYYTMLLSRLMPDYLRYFRAHGLRLSQGWVEEEFKWWIGINPHTQSRTFALCSSDPSAPSASRVVTDAVVPMGNGTLMFPNSKNDADRTKARYHAITGSCLELLDGTRDFYVLTSYVPTQEEMDQYYPPGAQKETADEFLDELRSRFTQADQFFYWIFAVKRDAPQAHQKLYDTSRAPPLSAPSTPTQVGAKREEREDDQPDVEAESPVSRARMDEEEEFDE